MVARNPTVPTRTVRVAGVPVRTTVTARQAVARRWVYTSKWRLRRCRNPTVGMGVQWTPRFRAGAGAGDERAGTLQLCVGNRCLVFQIARANGVPMILRRFLADRRVTFAGYNVGLDCRKLLDHHGLAVASTAELRRASGMGNASLEEMAAAHLGLRERGGGLAKSRKVGVSRWDGPRLSNEQVRYACVDAYLSLRLGVHLRRREEEEDDDEASSEASSVHGVIRGDYGGGREVLMLGLGAHPGYHHHHDEEEDCGVEDYDDHDDDDDVDNEHYRGNNDGPGYDSLNDEDRMVGAIFGYNEHWNGCSCHACFPDDVEDVEQEPLPFQPAIRVLA